MVPQLPLLYLLSASGVAYNSPDAKIATGFAVLVILLFFSAMISGSEVAFFSLTPEEIEKLKNRKSGRADLVLKLIKVPDRLLSTILVANNVVNVTIVLLAAFLSTRLFSFENNPVLGFILEVVVITMLLLFFGEILPKVYAARNHLSFALFMSRPVRILERVFSPAATLLIKSTSFVKKRTPFRQKNVSMDDLSNALELASDDINEDEKILKGIVNFGNIYVSEIMCSRIDVTAIEIKTQFSKIIPLIIESGFSRIPVYSGSFDSVKGILYAKDVLPHTDKPDNFPWQTLLRPPYFVPETKKINDLLKEFQINKIHMAVVVDEYGGTSGIITLEDILEEIVGEITDESDEEENHYRKIDEKTFVFEGKVLLNDFYKIIGAGEDPFEDVRGESETLAGLLLEMTGEIPQKGKVISYGNFVFRIESADRRRIKEIRVELTGGK